MSVYTGTLLKINNQNLPSLKEYKVGRNKLWKDADRAMTGTVKATLIGIFPKLELKFNYMSQDEMATVCSILDQAYFNVTYFDVRVQGTTTAKYYAADYTPELSSKYRGLYNPLSVNLIPVEKRRY